MRRRRRLWSTGSVSCTTRVPPVQALKRYQAGFASRFSVSRPAEPQNWQVPPSSVQENHQIPPIRQERGGGEHREGLESSSAWPASPRSHRDRTCPSPSPAPSRRGASAVVVEPHDPPQVPDLSAHRPGVGHIRVQRHPVEEASGCPPVEASRKVPEGTLGGTCSGRPKRPPRITFDPGRADAGRVPEAPDQPREALRVGAAEGDDVGLVPDLPVADRLRCQFGIFAQNSPQGP